MKISRRNYDDFKKEVQRLTIATDSCFSDLTISELKDLFTASELLLSEWAHLDSDIEEMFSIIENIEE
jgi:hypothetical protein